LRPGDDAECHCGMYTRIDPYSQLAALPSTRHLLHGNDPKVLDDWIRDAMSCGIYTMQKFAAKLRYDIDAVRDTVCEPWSNGQTEGQINRLKMLKRAMDGRTSTALLRTRDASPPRRRVSPNVNRSLISGNITAASQLRKSSRQASLNA
jgi:Transposase